MFCRLFDAFQDFLILNTPPPQKKKQMLHTPMFLTLPFEQHCVRFRVSWGVAVEGESEHGLPHTTIAVQRDESWTLFVKDQL